MDARGGNYEQQARHFAPRAVMDGVALAEAQEQLARAVLGVVLLAGLPLYNIEAAADKLALIGRVLGAEVTSGPEAAQSAAQAVDRLLVRIGHPTRLSEVGVKAGDLKACAELALTDPATITNPRAVVSPKQVMEVFEKAL